MVLRQNLASALGVLLFALLSAWLHRDLRAFAEKLVGHVNIDQAKLVQWENSTELNNGECTVVSAANACEDVKIHFASSTAFVACGDPVGRTQWYPPACVRDVATRREETFREHLFKYDIKSGRTVKLDIKGLDGDFVNHGIDLFQSPSDPSKVKPPVLNAVRFEGDADQDT